MRRSETSYLDAGWGTEMFVLQGLVGSGFQVIQPYSLPRASDSPVLCLEETSRHQSRGWLAGGQLRDFPPRPKKLVLGAHVMLAHFLVPEDATQNIGSLLFGWGGHGDPSKVPTNTRAPSIFPTFWAHSQNGLFPLVFPLKPGKRGFSKKTDQTPSEVRQCELVDATATAILVALSSLLVAVVFLVIGWHYRDALRDLFPRRRRLATAVFLIRIKQYGFTGTKRKPPFVGVSLCGSLFGVGSSFPDVR